MEAYIDPTDFPCFIDSQKIEPKSIKCIGADKCKNKGCPLVADRDERDEE
jgi:hypothetical protein